MAEVALIGVATAVAQGLAQLVAARALDEIKLAWGLENELQKLHQKFEYIQAFLEDAGNSKYAQKSKLVNLWVQKVKDVAYLADDVMDECSIEIFRRKMELQNRSKKLGKFSTTFNHTFPRKARKVMAGKIKDILSKFDEIDKEAMRIGLSQVNIAVTETCNNDDQLSQLRQNATANASNFVGRKDDLEKLLDFTCSPSNYNGVGLSTVAVVGMGGVGKTALTRHLYDDKTISAYFGNNKIWICVSHNFEINRLLNEMVELVTLRESKLLNHEAIIRKLQEELKGKKFLIVFDDVWNHSEDTWNCLKGWLHRIGCAPGSVFLINTRSDEVADAAGAFFKHKLEGLSSNDSWILLQQIVSTNNPIYSSFEKAGRRITEKCKGLPSAIKVIGSVLQSKQHLHEWESIEKTELWNSPHYQNQILQLLLLSFNQLPSPSLKQCFAYCAVIPKGHYVSKTELIGLWLSQGYLRNDKRTSLTMEELGEENLKILLGNSLLEECVSLEPGIVGYKMHDFVYELAVDVCGTELIMKVNDLRGTGSCRHLVLTTTENIAPLDIPPETDLTKLRTLSLNGTVILWNILTHTRYLRTLKLDHTGITEVSPTIEQLKHLRFLDVSYNPITTLPDSIGKLYQLQTLILQGCKDMKKLPKVVNKLVNLRHILTTAPMFACKGLQQLTNLQSLPCLSLNDEVEGWSIDELGELHELNDEIHIRGLECLKDADEGKKADLSGKTGVSKLTLFWAEDRKQNNESTCDEDVLGGLEPHLNLKSLEVQNFIGVRFPIWIMGMAVLAKGQGGNRIRLNYLTTVKILNCSRCQTLPKLGHLPLLKCLILSGFNVDYIGIEFYGGDDLDLPGTVSFKYLKELEISGFRRLMTWMQPPKAAFPNLETLRLRDCDRLNSVPVFESNSLVNLELKHLNSVECLDILKYSLGLTSLIMDMLPKVASVPQELANCKKLHILNISNCDGLVLLPIIQRLLRLSLSDREGWSINELGDEIHITGLECVKDKKQAKKVSFVAKANISRLALAWAEEREENTNSISDELVLEGLDPHPSTTSLELKNFTGVMFPVWITRMAVLAEVPTNTWIPLNNLTTIKLLNCNKCRTLPKLGQLPLLECLILDGLDVELIDFEFYGDLTMPAVPFRCLRELEISWFRKLTTWMEPPKEAFPHLETIRIRDCAELKSIPALDTKSLLSLDLYGLHNIESLDVLRNSSSLTSLTLINLFKITSLPQELANCRNLQILKLEYLSRLTSFPTLLESFVNLKEMRLHYCPDFEFVMGDLLRLRFSLRVLDIEFGASVRMIPTNLEECTSLEMLVTLNPRTRGFPTNISKLRRLLELRMVFISAKHVRSVAESAKDLPLLRGLEIICDWSSSAEEMSESFSDIIPFLRLPSLRELKLSDFSSIKTLPQQLGFLTQITTLSLSSFDELEEIPDWICNLSSLVSLSLELCLKLTRLPSKADMQRLTYLSIINCPLLKERYDKNEGSEWHHISDMSKIWGF